MIPLVLALLSEPPTVERYLPCAVGLEVDYLRTSKKSGAQRRYRDRVVGPGKEPRSCVLERTSEGEPAVRFVREHLADRVLNAGWIDRPLAFRDPLLKAPLETGAKWVFNTTRYEIRSVGRALRVPAGELSDVVEVAERSEDGTHEAVNTYALGVGFVRYESKEAVTEAARICPKGCAQKAP